MSATNSTDDSTEHEPVQVGDHINPSDYSNYYSDEETRWQGYKMDNDRFGDSSATVAWDGHQIVALYRREGVQNQDGSPVRYKVKAVADYDDPEIDVELEESAVDHYNEMWGSDFTHEEVEEQVAVIVREKIHAPEHTGARWEDIGWSDGDIKLHLWDEGEGVDVRATIA